MEKIKRLLLCTIPNHKCNLKCEYCYISQVNQWDDSINIQQKYSAEHIAKCLSKKRLGGTCMINITGYGETLLQHSSLEIIKALLEEGHYVEIVTNGTVKKHINEILTWPNNLLSRLEFKISFHYSELKRLQILESFFDTVNRIQKSEASFTLELMANDSLEDKIDEIKTECINHLGAPCIGTIGRDDSKKDKGLLSRHSVEEYRNIWKKLDSIMIDYKIDVLGKKRNEFCYAGDWSLFINLYTGESRQCYEMPDNQNIFEDPDKPIKFIPIGRNCRLPYCMNAHAHLAWGMIPELYAPTYYEMRNRKTTDGGNWIKKGCEEFFQTKLYETNMQLNSCQKIFIDCLFPFRMIFSLCRNIPDNMAKVKKYFKRK